MAAQRGDAGDILDDVLVVAVRKSFWASPDAEAFPRRVEARVLYGHSTNLVNSLLVTVRALLGIARRRPRLVLLGSVERTVPWFMRLRALGLLRSKLVVVNQLHLDDEQLKQVDAVVLYSRAVIEAARPALRERSVFAPLPADGDFEAARARAEPGDHVFSGGGAGRDFGLLVEAVRGTDVTLELVTFDPGRLDGISENVRVLGRMPLQAFVERMAAARFVAVPLREPDSPHGQTTVVQALALGKAVVATRAAGVVDYVEDGREGLLVEAGDVAGYREAILRLARDDELRGSCERHARARAEQLTYAAFGERLAALCRDLLDA